MSRNASTTPTATFQTGEALVEARDRQMEAAAQSVAGAVQPEQPVAELLAGHPEDGLTPTSEMLRDAARRESIEICRDHAALLANMAIIDEAVDALCDGIAAHYGRSTEGVDRIVKAHAALYEAAKREVGDILFSSLFDRKNATNL